MNDKPLHNKAGNPKAFLLRRRWAARNKDGERVVKSICAARIMCYSALVNNTLRISPAGHLIRQARMLSGTLSRVRSAPDTIRVPFDFAQGRLSTPLRSARDDSPTFVEGAVSKLIFKI